MAHAALTLSDPVADRVREGWTQLPLESLPASGPTLAPGRPLILVDARGGILGTGVADPENELLRIVSRDAEGTLDRAFFRPRVQRAHRLRESLGLAGAGGAYRLIHGEGDALPGFHADVFGAHAVLSVPSRGWVELGRVLGETLLELPGMSGVVLKVRPREGPKPSALQQEVLGAEPPERMVVSEGAFRFEVHLLGGLNVGLFTDMREHRRGLARFARGRRVLNTFCYTGTLSVSAAVADAASVVSVDLSTGVLKWARENFRLSGLDPDAGQYRFEAAEVTRFVAGEAARGARYDLVILDPPTYSAARPRQWTMRDDYPALIAQAAGLIPAEGGLLWVSANVRRGIDLGTLIETGLERAGRSAQVLEVGGLPPDHPTPFATPEARYLQVYLLAVS